MHARAHSHLRPEAAGGTYFRAPRWQLLAEQHIQLELGCSTQYRSSTARDMVRVPRLPRAPPLFLFPR